LWRKRRDSTLDSGPHFGLRASITKNLEQLGKVEHLDDISKAQLMLGYLADVSGDEETATSETNNEQKL